MTLIPKHQNTNRSVGNVFLPGIIDIDTEFPIYFEEPAVGKIRTPKWMSLRDILRKVYVKIGGHKITVFQYVFKTRGGTFQAWFWDKVPEISEFVQTYSPKLGSYLWHRCKGWGWQEPGLKRLFLACFDSDSAVVAMNSKWNSKKQKIIEVAIGSDAAHLLNFGTSPFILGPGETTLRRTPAAKPKITRSNLGHDQAGGIDVDDLESVSGQSNAETVFGKVSDEDSDDDEEMEDEDDVSDMDDDEGFEDDESTKAGSGDEDDADESEAEVLSEDESGDESTKAGYRCKEPVDTSNSEEESSAGGLSGDESTKAGLDDLKAKGKKVREDSEAQQEVDRLTALLQQQTEMLEAMRRQMQENSHSGGNNDSSGPGTAEGGGAEEEKASSVAGSEGGASAKQV